MAANPILIAVLVFVIAVVVILLFTLVNGKSEKPEQTPADSTEPPAASELPAEPGAEGMYVSEPGDIAPGPPTEDPAPAPGAPEDDPSG